MAVLFSPYLQAVDANGAPLSGAKLFFYRTGTTTEITTYQDSAETTPHTNPVVADASGVFAPIYIAYASNFKTVLKTSADVTVQTVDPASVTSIADGVSLENYGATGDGSTDDLAAIQAAIDAVESAGGGFVIASGEAKTYKIDGDLTISDGVIVDLRGSTIQVTNTTDSIIAESSAKIINGTLSASGVTSYVGPLWLTDDDGGYVRTASKFHGLEATRLIGPGQGASAAGTAIRLHGNGGTGISRTRFTDIYIANFATGILIDGESSWVNNNVFDGEIFGCVNFVQLDGNSNTYAVNGNIFDLQIQPNTSTTIADRAIDCIDGDYNIFRGFIWDWSTSGSSTAVEFGANASRNDMRGLFVDLDTQITDAGAGNSSRTFVVANGDTYVSGSRASGDNLIFDAPNASGGVYFRRNGGNICAFTAEQRIFFSGEIGSAHAATIKNSQSGTKTLDFAPVSGNFAVFETRTAAQIAAIGNSINTTGKGAGKLCWDTTNNRLMVASGSTAASPWYVADGSASVTPT